jgi:cell division protein FtsL
VKYRSKKRNKIYANRYTKSSSKFTKVLVGVMVFICLVSIIAAIALGIHVYRLEDHIKSATQQIDVATQQTKELDTKLSPLKKSIDELKTEANQLENIIWKYSPVVVPDKMQ